MCHKNTFNPTVVFIPSFIYHILMTNHSEHLNGQKVSNIEKYRHALHLDMLSTQLTNDEDIFLFVLQNEKIFNIHCADGSQLFDGCTSPYLEDRWLNDHMEDYQKYIENWKCQKEVPDHPLFWGLKDLGRIDHCVYDQRNNVLYLVDTDDNDDWIEGSDLDENYHTFLREVINVVGKYRRIEDLAKSNFFKEWLLFNKQVNLALQTQDRVNTSVVK